MDFFGPTKRLTCGFFIAVHLYAPLLRARTLPDARLDQTFRNSYELIFANLNRIDVSPGAVIASPSKSNPDYFYHWLRDASLTNRSLFAVYDATSDRGLQSRLLSNFYSWVSFEKRTQENSLTASVGLGEPIFLVTGDVATKPWGRPQSDGPASRATALSQWALYLIENGERKFVEDNLYKAELPARTLIKRDLEYVSLNWRLPSYDLWEEVKGTHFYTLAVQRKSLLTGAVLADKLSDPFAAQAYREQADAIGKELSKFLEIENREYISVTRDQVEGWTHKKSGLDIAVILAANHGLVGDRFFSDHQSKFIKTAEKIEDTFSTYPVNKDSKLARAIGRYPEDVYDGSGFSGGNPWFLATHAMAEFYCNLANMNSNPAQKKQLQEKGRSFLLRSLNHVNPTTGEMTEQFSRQSGALMGARNLTWSYASYLTAYLACRSN